MFNKCGCILYIFSVSGSCEHEVECECVKFVQNVPLHDTYYIFVLITFTIIVRGCVCFVRIIIVTAFLSFESIRLYKTDYEYNSISADRFRISKCRYHIHSVQFSVLF